MKDEDEDEERVRQIVRGFSEAAKDIMWLTNEIHDVLDKLCEASLQVAPNISSSAALTVRACLQGENQENVIGNVVINSVRNIREKLCHINAVNMEKLYGIPKSTYSDVDKKSKEELC